MAGSAERVALTALAVVALVLAGAQPGLVATFGAATLALLVAAVVAASVLGAVRVPATSWAARGAAGAHGAPVPTPLQCEPDAPGGARPRAPGGSAPR